MSIIEPITADSEFTIDTSTEVLDSTGKPMIVGDKYEMYAPAAKGASKALGLVFKDDVGYSFTYAGTANLRGNVVVCTPDVTYDVGVLGIQESLGLLAIMRQLGDAAPLCPTYIAAQFVRPVTDE